MTSFPNKILFKTDDSIAEFLEEVLGSKIDKKKGVSALYKYTKANYKLGMITEFSLKNIESLYKGDLIKIVKF